MAHAVATLDGASTEPEEDLFGDKNPMEEISSKKKKKKKKDKKEKKSNKDQCSREASADTGRTIEGDGNPEETT